MSRYFHNYYDRGWHDGKRPSEKLEGELEELECKRYRCTEEYNRIIDEPLMKGVKRGAVIGICLTGIISTANHWTGNNLGLESVIYLSLGINAISFLTGLCSGFYSLTKDQDAERRMQYFNEEIRTIDQEMKNLERDIKSWDQRGL